MDSTLSHSRPLGQSLPLDENVWVLSICMLPCRRSSHGDSSPSLRLFALGPRANKCRLMEPCCLGGSPFSFDQARGVLLFVLSLTLCRFLLSAALLDIGFCFLIFLYFLLLLLVEGFFFAVVVSRDVFLFSCLLISWLLSSCPVCAASIAGPSVRVHV